MAAPRSTSKPAVGPFRPAGGGQDRSEAQPSTASQRHASAAQGTRAPLSTHTRCRIDRREIATHVHRLKRTHSASLRVRQCCSASASVLSTVQVLRKCSTTLASRNSRIFPMIAAGSAVSDGSDCSASGICTHAVAAAPSASSLSPTIFYFFKYGSI